MYRRNSPAPYPEVEHYSPWNVPGRLRSVIGNAVHDGVVAWDRLLTEHRDPQDPVAPELAFQAAGLVGASTAPTALAGGVPRNALTSGFGRRSLPADLSSRLSRAETMGFDTSERLFHGTNRGFRRFDLDRSLVDERAAWVTPSPELAANFARFSVEAGSPSRRSSTWTGTRVLPLYIRGRQKVVDRDYLEREYGAEFANRRRNDPEYVSPIEGESGSILYDSEFFARELDRARREGYDVVRFRNVEEAIGPPADQVAVLDPANLRSTNALFNPRYSSSRSLLSANPPAALPMLLPAEGD